ncbi:hypothetical protein [Nonomuraea bangladeshensis]|uniref:hypothetical protein n=1 Tax=Nonomuraea bangladeshensis TaxID=404385 RepID=UPI0031D94232
MTNTDAITGVRRPAIEDGHARALHDHGPSWAIMWDDRDNQPIIVRPERGDDGALLEICAYEDMFTLDGDCVTCEDAHACGTCGHFNFEVIAEHMTDILGDYLHGRDDIATCMPLTLPYTRTLTPYGIRRLFQGTRHGDTFRQFYRSPEGHLIELIIPLSYTPADISTPPLTIEWTYLGLTGPDASWPVTHVTIDTPPADVAELIAAHIAIHPPIPSADATASPDAPEGANSATTT